MFGATLKKLRDEKGMSQQKLAEIMGLTQQAIAKWETEKSEPDLKTVAKLADFFEVSVDYLLDRNARTPNTRSNTYNQNVHFADHGESTKINRIGFITTNQDLNMTGAKHNNQPLSATRDLAYKIRELLYLAAIDQKERNLIDSQYLERLSRETGEYLGLDTSEWEKLGNNAKRLKEILKNTAELMLGPLPREWDEADLYKVIFVMYEATMSAVEELLENF